MKRLALRLCNAKFVIRKTVLLIALSCLPMAVLLAQSASANLSGTVVDQNGAVVPGATVKISNRATGLQRQVETNDEGAFTVPLLPPSNYSVRVERQGFSPVEVPSVVLNVGDQKALQIQLKAGDVNAQVVVDSNAETIRTDAAVGTVVDRQFVANIPLNGRSLQSLLELTPGTVLAVANHASQEGGQFTVNGQRTNSNYWTVDGVSANAGISAGVNTNPGESGSGSLPTLTAVGSTSSLVSVDALQEFRIQTSTFAPEFGRMPGGQVSLVTRSGANDFHGTLFEYFRDDSLDATDWFINANPKLSKTQLRQHQFGGVIGGPVFFPKFGEGGPRWYNGKNRTFFFFSYEGLRLTQPKASIVNVPTLAARSILPAASVYLNAWPLPNGPDISPGLAQFAASWSDDSRFDATSVRIDHSVGEKLSFFGRFSYTPSYARNRTASLNTITTFNQKNASLTGGSSWTISKHAVNDFRANYTINKAPVFSELDNFGGAVPPPTSIFSAGRGPLTALFAPLYEFSTQWVWGNGNAFQQRQINFVDNVTIGTGSHQWKVGLDFRRINPLLGGEGNPIGFQAISFTLSDLQAGRAQLYQNITRVPDPHSAAFENLSLYFQDTWRPTPRFTLTYGLRWEFVPPPHATEGDDAVTLENLDNPYGGNVRLAPRGTTLWVARYNNFAPRIGASYVLSQKPGSELIVRGGAGVFHDIGFGQVANSYYQWPFFALKNVTSPSLPLSPSVLAAPELGSTPPSLFYLMDRNIRIPRVYQWNVAVERSFRSRQTLTASYVGAAGRDLIKPSSYETSLVEWPGSTATLVVGRNTGFSDYRALQLQFQRRLNHGLQTLISYTFGRSRDNSSSDFTSPQIPAELLSPKSDYGNSDYDVRHVLTAAVTYQVPKFTGSSFLHVMARNWGIDTMIRSRTGFPIKVSTTIQFAPITYAVRPNVVPGQPFWIDDPNAPDGRRLNRLAFTIPPANTQGNLKRGVIPGFGARQVDLALRREFGLFEKVRLQMRFEMFNIFNTPNFADPTANLRAGQNPATFGASIQMLNRGLGGLSPLYQIGGPRSAQVSAKIIF